MTEPKQIRLSFSQQRVLDALNRSISTWDELRAQTKINEEQLGLGLNELLNLRKIWTGYRGDERVYGIERRIGSVPRLTYEQRRESDFL